MFTGRCVDGLLNETFVNLEHTQTTSRASIMLVESAEEKSIQMLFSSNTNTLLTNIWNVNFNISTLYHVIIFIKEHPISVINVYNQICGSNPKGR